MIQFSAQALYLIVVAGLAFLLHLNDVHTAQLSQGINVFWISVIFFIGWKMLPDVPSRHEMHKDRSIWTEGFKQIWHTSVSINRNYPHGLRWFLVATVFADAGANAFTVISVIFLNDHLGMNSTEIALVFLITLVACVPGAKIGSIVIKKTDPNTSWKIAMAIFCVATFSGAFALAGPDQSYLAYVWGTIWGFILGYDDYSGRLVCINHACLTGVFFDTDGSIQQRLSSFRWFYRKDKRRSLPVSLFTVHKF
jgi:MFS-type transporter involved in bile tolerance (Atg22 family)